MTKVMLSFSQLAQIKTEKCISEQCSKIAKANKLRMYKPVFVIENFHLNCFGYHTEKDKRRQVFEKEGIKNNLIAEYGDSYMVDIFEENNELNGNTQNNSIIKDIFERGCKNFVEYIYHPNVYKTIQCIYENINSETSQKKSCSYEYCPYIHHYQKLDPDLISKLEAFRSNNLSESKVNGFSEKLQTQKREFEQKIIDINNIRSVNLIQNKNESLQQSNFQQIQKIKQKLLQKAFSFFQIDKQKQIQQQSRKVQQNIGLFGQIKKIEVNDKQNFMTSYNYFNYGERLGLVEGRQIEFKHFKDISEAQHIPLIMRYITAYLNSQGGKLFIGVDDNCYVYGAKFKQSEYDKLLLNIDRQGRFNVTPPLMPQKYEIKRIPVYHQRRKGQERWVIEITVFPVPQKNKKLFLYNRQCYMRMNASTHKLNASDIIQFFSMNPSMENLDDLQHHALQQQVTEAKIGNNEQRKASYENLEPSSRQNNLMSSIVSQPIQGSRGHSQRKPQIVFETQQQKKLNFQQKLAAKSLQQLYTLRKDYESKLVSVMQAYRKKERELR